MRPNALCLLLLAGCAVGCAQEMNPATAISISVKTNLAIDAELSSIEYRVFPADGNPQSDQPAARFAAPAAQLERPYVVEKNEDQEVLIAVQGFGPAKDAIVEFRTRARFEAGKTVEIPVFLGKECVRKACVEGVGQTCHGEARYDVAPGSCGAVPFPNDPTELTAKEQTGKWVPRLDAGAVGDGGDGGACTVRPDAGVCDPIAKCGCLQGQSCQTAPLTGAPFCAPQPAQPKPRHASCEAPSECGPGLTCFEKYCTEICVQDAECGQGDCIRLSNAPYGACVPKCGEGLPACPAGIMCTPLDVPILQLSGKAYCMNPAITCGTVQNGTCDEPGGGTGLCAPGSDVVDCTCDPVAQTRCGARETCQVIPQSSATTTGATWTDECLPVGPTPLSGPCKADTDCAIGLSCISGLCRPYCRAAADCKGGGQCIPIEVRSIPLTPMIGSCEVPCTSDANCAAGSTCAVRDGGVGACRAP